MTKCITKVLIGVHAFLLLATLMLPAMVAAETPTVLNCTINAHANRDYGFARKTWMGSILAQGKEPTPSKPFEIVTENLQEGMLYRNKTFIGLDTSTPVIKSILPAHQSPTARLKEFVEEFNGTVVSRTDDAVFLVWKNPSGNKVWSAAIDLTHRKATLGYVFQGLTSVGVATETFDCR